MIELNTENFNTEIKKGPIIVDFWAEWCSPCKQLAPVFEEVSMRNDQLKFAKVDVQANHDLAAANGVTGIPCLIVFKSGKELGRIVGFRDKNRLQSEIDKIMG